MINENIVCGLCSISCNKLDVIVLKDNQLYYANRINCPSCHYTLYELTEPICGKESSDKFNYFLTKAIDISK